MSSDTWDERHIQSLRRSLKRAWPWERIASRWAERVQAFGVQFPCPVVDLPLFDPAHPYREQELSTCVPAGRVNEVHVYWQRHFNQMPGTKGAFVWPFTANKGQQITTALARRFAADADKLAAVFVYALAHELSHIVPPDCGPGILRVLGDAARARLGSDAPEWLPRQKNVFPNRGWPRVWHLSSVEGFLDYCAEVSAKFLTEYALVRFHCAPAVDLRVAAVLREEECRAIVRAERSKHLAAAEAERRKVGDAEREVERQRMLALHPRWGEWPDVGRDELERLVWSKPALQLAKEFGVSDVAINKRCKVLGIRRPPVGFWRKVEARVLPHPNGVMPKPVDPRRPRRDR